MALRQTFRRLCRHDCCHWVAVVILCTASNIVAQPAAEPLPNPPWAQQLKDPALLTAFGNLFEKMQHEVEFPPSRSHSQLLTLLPRATIFYAAFPNYGNASHQALRIFQQEVHQNAALQDWWQHGDMAAKGLKVEDSLEKFFQLSQYLGEEIVVAGAAGERKDPTFLIIAEVRQPGLKDFLQKMAKELAGKSAPAVRILDLKELASAKDAVPSQKLVILVRPDLVVAAGDVAELRSFNAALEGKKGAFAATPFGQKMVQAYEGGVTVVGGADMQKILSELFPGTTPDLATFQRTGFSDMKYLVWQHNRVDGQEVSQMEVSFTGPRRGVASWLAAPAPMGSLDFVSPKAIMVATLLLRSPAQIFQEVKELSTASNPQALAGLMQMERTTKLSFKDDIMGPLAGEITLEVDSLEPTQPQWKVVLRVSDPERLQATLNKLLAGAPTSPLSAEEPGITYHTLPVPSPNKAIEIGYALVDGYIIVASNRPMLAEAVRLHRTGESFGKSPRLLASIPPGHSSEASALFYQDPVALTALRLRQLLPGVPESLSHANADAPSSVMYVYGEENALREVSRSGGLDATAVLVGAAIAIPNLLRARIAANESSAVAMVRTALVAQISYASSYPKRGYARDFAMLGPDPRGGNMVSAEHASMIEATLGNPACAGGAWCSKSGFRFAMDAVCKNQRCDEFVVVATPENSGTGSRNFCSTSDGVIRVETGPPLTVPMSASECLAWPPLQ